MPSGAAHLVLPLPAAELVDERGSLTNSVLSSGLLFWFPSPGKLPIAVTLSYTLRMFKEASPF